MAENIKRLLTIAEYCDQRRIHPSTYYRGVKKGIYPAPSKYGPGVSRIADDQAQAYDAKAAAAGRAA